MLFSPQAVPAIHQYGGGTPRLINTICDNCLLEAFLMKVPHVDLKVVHSVVGDLGLLPQPLTTLQKEEPREELDHIESMLDRLEKKA
jgi:general secretion pathway protein A